MYKKFAKMIFGSLVIALLVFPNTVMASTTRRNQDATAYDDTGKGASGATLEIGSCAVHYQNGNHLNPVIPFGTFIYIDSISSDQGTDMDFILTSGGEVKVWRVDDTGTGAGLSTYWIDFWLGNSADCQAFGKGKVTYHY